MFEKITLRRSENGVPFSIGHLAEAMLFHQNVHVLLDRWSTIALAKSLGSDLLLSILERPEVTATFTEQILATHTKTVNGISVYDWGAIQFAGDQDRGVLKKQARITDIFLKAGLPKGEAKKASRRFRELTKTRSLTSNYYAPGGIPEAAREEATDMAYFSHALATSLANDIKRPELAKEFKFEITRIDGGFFVVDNVNWEQVNEERKKILPNVDDIGCAHVLSSFQNAVADLHIASHYGGEYVTDSISSQLTRLKYSKLLKRIGRDTNSVSEFQDAVLDNAAAVRECINSGEKTFAEFLRVIDRRDGKKFKEFWAGVNSDENVLRAYFEESSRRGWIENIPSKTIRFAFCTTIGAVSLPVGIALSASDSFLVEKLTRGWRPHHFVERHLKPFAES